MGKAILTDPDFIKKLETLSLLSRKVLGGTLKADRKTRKKGSGINFADYVEYNYGDDYRNIDWNIYARLENMVIKLFELEEDVRIYILLDLSPSMKSKLIYAKKLAAALSYIALNNLDRLAIYGISDHLEVIFKPGHGRNKLFPMLEALENAECYGHNTIFEEPFKKFYLRHRRPGVCVLVSDFFVPGGYAKAMDYLTWNKHEVFCIQVINPDEQQCTVRGDVEFQCVETKAIKKVTVGPLEAARFAAAMKEWNEGLKRTCAGKGIGLVPTSTSIPFETVIQDILRRGGLVS